MPRVYPMPEATRPEEWLVTDGTDIKLHGENLGFRIFPVDPRRRIVGGVSDDTTPLASINRVLRTASIRWCPDDQYVEVMERLNSAHAEGRIRSDARRAMFWAFEQARLLTLADQSGLDWHYVGIRDFIDDRKLVTVRNNLSNHGLSIDYLMFFVSVANTYDGRLEGLAEMFKVDRVESKKVDIDGTLVLAKRIVAAINNDPTLENLVRIVRDLLLKSKQFSTGAYSAQCPSIGTAATSSKSQNFDKVNDGKRTITIEDFNMESAYEFKKAWNDNHNGEALKAAFMDGVKGSGPVAKVSGTTWGKLKGINRLELNSLTGITGLKKAKRVRSLEYGAVMRTPHRVTIDQRVFRVREKDKGGTVLIDASGSMSLQPAQILAITKHAHKVTVAGYCGDAAGGFITILAEKMKCAPQFEIEGWTSQNKNGNVIDGPALEWLAQQPRPRIWVSDGHVTGVNDVQTPKNVADTARILAQGRIIWLKNMKQAAQLMEHGRIQK